MPAPCLLQTRPRSAPDLPQTHPAYAAALTHPAPGATADWIDRESFSLGKGVCRSWV